MHLLEMQSRKTRAWLNAKSETAEQLMVGVTGGCGQINNNFFFFFFLVGTQTTLTFPGNLDLEKMLSIMCRIHQHGGVYGGVASAENEEERGRGGGGGGIGGVGGSCESEGVDYCNTSTLRRKLFGQPERQV